MYIRASSCTRQKRAGYGRSVPTHRTSRGRGMVSETNNPPCREPARGTWARWPRRVHSIGGPGHYIRPSSRGHIGTRYHETPLQTTRANGSHATQHTQSTSLIDVVSRGRRSAGHSALAGSVGPSKTRVVVNHTRTRKKASVRPCERVRIHWGKFSVFDRCYRWR